MLLSVLLIFCQQQASGSITYSVSDLPKQLQSTVSHDLRRLLEQAALDSSKPQSFTLAKGGALPVPAGTHAYNVKFGFKAPVAMTLMPWWREVCPHLMFIHVTRDGRDIAFSANQVPVLFVCFRPLRPSFGGVGPRGQVL